MNYFFRQTTIKCKQRHSLKTDVSSVRINETETSLEISDVAPVSLNKQSPGKTAVSKISSENEMEPMKRIAKRFKKFQKLSSSLLDELGNILDKGVVTIEQYSILKNLNYEKLMNKFNDLNLESVQNKHQNEETTVQKPLEEEFKKSENTKEKLTATVYNNQNFESKINAPSVQFILSSQKSNSWILDINFELTISTFDWMIKKLRSSLKHIEMSSKHENSMSWLCKPKISYYNETPREIFTPLCATNISNLHNLFDEFIKNVKIKPLHHQEIKTPKDIISNDGTRCIYYPDGQLAILHINSNNRNLLLVYDCDHTGNLLALFSSRGIGLVFSSNYQCLKIHISQHSCKMFNSMYQVERNMKWPTNINNKLPFTLNIKLNSFVSLYCCNKDHIFIKFEFHEKQKPAIIPIHEWLFLESTILLEEPKILQCNASYTSNYASELQKLNSKKSKKEELSKLNESEVKHGEDIGHYKEKIRLCFENWIKYYKSRVYEKPSNKRVAKSASLIRNKENKCFINKERTRMLSSGRVSAQRNHSNLREIEITTVGQSNNVRIDFQRSRSALERSITSEIIVCPKRMQAKFISNQGYNQPNHPNDFKDCYCKKLEIPEITDIELFKFLSSVRSSQIIVIGIISTGSSAIEENSKGKFIENSLATLIREIYAEDLKHSCQKPCVVYDRKTYRLLLYDINTSGKYLNSTQSLLVRKHKINAGMCLMFQNGRLMFADYIFNGYTTTKSDLFKQINLVKQSSESGFHLPNDFQLSFNNESKQWIEEAAFTKIQSFNHNNKMFMI